MRRDALSCWTVKTFPFVIGTCLGCLAQTAPRIIREAPAEQRVRSPLPRAMPGAAISAPVVHEALNPPTPIILNPAPAAVNHLETIPPDPAIATVTGGTFSRPSSSFSPAQGTFSRPAPTFATPISAAPPLSTISSTFRHSALVLPAATTVSANSVPPLHQNKSAFGAIPATLANGGDQPAESASQPPSRPAVAIDLPPGAIIRKIPPADSTKK